MHTVQLINVNDVGLSDHSQTYQMCVYIQQIESMPEISPAAATIMHQLWTQLRCQIQTITALQFCSIMLPLDLTTTCCSGASKR